MTTDTYILILLAELQAKLVEERQLNAKLSEEIQSLTSDSSEDSTAD